MKYIRCDKTNGEGCDAKSKSNEKRKINNKRSSQKMRIQSAPIDHKSQMAYSGVEPLCLGPCILSKFPMTRYAESRAEIGGLSEFDFRFLFFLGG